MSKSRTTAWVAGFACVTALAAFSVSGVAAQTPPAGPGAAHEHQAVPSPPAGAVTQDDGSKTMGQNMMAMRQKMMAEQKAANARLQPLIEKMNAARGEARVEAMAAVITELVHQRTEQMGQMSEMTMPNNMMGMMMQGMTDDMRKMAAQCPMMKGAGGTEPRR